MFFSFERGPLLGSVTPQNKTNKQKMAMEELHNKKITISLLNVQFSSFQFSFICIVVIHIHRCLRPLKIRYQLLLSLFTNLDVLL